MRSADIPVLRAAIGTYPHSRPLKSGEIASDLLRLEFAEISPINRAFAPMVRENRFDVCEMAIAARPDLVTELIRMFHASQAAALGPAERRTLHLLDYATIEPAIELALRYATEHGLLPRRLTAQEVLNRVQGGS